MKNADTLLVPHARNSPDKLNPRQHFETAPILEMADSIRQHGVITNLVVRPAYCEGTTTASELAAARPAGGLEAWTGPLKIVSGERRWRAGGLIIKSGELGKFNPDEVPVRIKELTDPEYEELTLAEQVARKELTPMEEARSFRRQLDYLNDEKKPRHTPGSLARTLGYASDKPIYERLKLLVLTGEPAGDALETGKIGPKLAVLIARIPDKAARAAAAKEIMKGNDGEPMTYKQAAEFIAAHFMRTLAGAPFDQTNAGLCPTTGPGQPDHGKWSGACTDCPHRTGNNKALFGDVKRGDTCTRPGCYEDKVKAARELIAAAARKEGKRVLTQAESEQVFPAHHPVGMMAHNSQLVALDEVPEQHLLKTVVKNAPSWREIAAKVTKKGMVVPVIVAFDQHGRAVECTLREPLMAGAEKAGEPIFRGKNEPTTKEDDEFKKRQREEAEAGKLRTHCAIFAMEAFYRAILASGATGAMFTFLYYVGMDTLSGEGASLLAKWQGLKPDGTVGWTGVVKKWIEKLPGEKALMVAPLLLLAEKMRWHGLQDDTGKGYSLPVQALADAFKLDLKAIEKAATAEFNAKKNPKVKPSPAKKADKTKPKKPVNTKAAKGAKKAPGRRVGAK